MLCYPYSSIASCQSLHADLIMFGVKRKISFRGYEKKLGEKLIFAAILILNMGSGNAAPSFFVLPVNSVLQVLTDKFLGIVTPLPSPPRRKRRDLQLRSVKPRSNRWRRRRSVRPPTRSRHSLMESAMTLLRSTRCRRRRRERWCLRRRKSQPRRLLR